MKAEEIRRALLEAARQGMLEILDEEMRLESLLADLPEADRILALIRNRLGLGQGSEIAEDLKKEDIADISTTIRVGLGEPVAEAFKEVVKQPKMLRALRKLISTHPEDFGSMDPDLCRRYADVLLDFAEKYVDTPKWVKTQSLIIIADALVNNVRGPERPRLDARLEVNWGIYLWKCGDYSEAENKFNNASDALVELMNRSGGPDADPVEKARNAELQVRVLQGLGMLYGDVLEDKTRSIGYNKVCLLKLSELEDTFQRRKLRTSILNNLGVAYHRMAERFPAEKERFLTEAALHYEEALTVARSIHYRKLEGWILFNAGEIYALLGQLQKARRYSAESRHIFETGVPSERGLSGVEMLDAVIGMERKDYRRALESIDRSLEIRQRIGEPRRIADALDLRGDIRLASGDMEGAAVDYREARAIYESIGSAAGVGRTGGKLQSLG